MNDKFQPGEEKFEDVEGHAGHARFGLPKEPTEDTEGHGYRHGGAMPEEPTEDDTEADTEGHGRFNV